MTPRCARFDGVAGPVVGLAPPDPRTMRRTTVSPPFAVDVDVAVIGARVGVTVACCLKGKTPPGGCGVRCGVVLGR